jgi:hypothetical protein
MVGTDQVADGGRGTVTLARKLYSVSRFLAAYAFGMLGNLVSMPVFIWKVFVAKFL